MLDCNFFEIKEFKLKNRPIISIKGTSLVYEVVQQNDKFQLIRLDQSNFKGYNFFAYQFVQKDTLFSVGGYGFWHYRNVMTFFDKKIEVGKFINIIMMGPMPLHMIYAAITLRMMESGH